MPTHDPPTVETEYTAKWPGRLQISHDKCCAWFADDEDEEKMFRFSSRMPVWLSWIPILGWAKKVLQTTEAKFQHGCLNPAMILDAERGIVAVYTDLTMHPDVRAPVIKVYEEKLHLIDHFTPEDGAEVATVAFYEDGPESDEEGRWADFDPTVINCMVEDAGACEEAFNRLPDSIWREMHLALEEISWSTDLGLYEVNVPSLE